MEYEVKEYITPSNYGEYVKAKIKEELESVPAEYVKYKKNYPDAVLLFRTGDFYEAYSEDAQVCSEVLGVTLTKMGNMRMAGFPYHALDTYLPKLIRVGKRIAICEKIEKK